MRACVHSVGMLCGYMPNSSSGYGLYIGSLFAGVIAYADDISILSCSCYGLQKLLDINFVLHMAKNGIYVLIQ